ncbi:hypothetical protein AVEN_109351-1 [Araneus ventricosus]|uniref:Uncharacterized protein n=1 Tax=Araneus ventricosus TaxID=182803 RepID=A0A4Y2GL67_ARAVE|nr:hypothetical protein AVEN_109351-1 [Araneus ventricosus]
MYGNGLPREHSLLLGRSVGGRMLTNMRSLRQYSVEPIVNEIVSLTKIMGLEVDSNRIDEACGRGQPRADHRRAYGDALCFTARICGREFVRGGNSKDTIF